MSRRLPKPSAAAVALSKAGLATLSEGLQLALHEGCLSPEVRASATSKVASLRLLVDELEHAAHSRQVDVGDVVEGGGS